MRSEKDRKTNRRNRAKITAHQKNMIRVWLEMGKTCKEIADWLSLPLMTVHNWRRWLGFPVKTREK